MGNRASGFLLSSPLPGAGDPTLVSDCALSLWGSGQLNQKEPSPGEKPSGYHARARVEIRADESTFCAVLCATLLRNTALR